MVLFPDPHTQQRMDYITAMRKEYIAYQAGDETRGGGGGSINTRAAGEGAFSGPNTKSKTPSGLMHFYKYHN